MGTGSYILKRFLASIPLLLIVSVISFAIIRLNITIKNINLSLFIFPIIAMILFYFLLKVKNWYFLGVTSLFSILIFSFSLAGFLILPFGFLLNFLFIFALMGVYWLQSFISKSSYTPQIIVLISLITFSTFTANNLPLNFPIKEIVLKTGDPLAELRFNPSISKEVLDKEEKRLGLKEPWHIQYLLWVKGIFHGDLGITQQNQSVAEVMKRPILNTLLLSLCTLFFTWLIAIPLGIWAAINKDKLIDKSLAIFTSCGMSVPTFVLAILGLLFALNTQIIPVGGLTSVYFYDLNFFEKILDIIKHLILPTVILTIISLAGLQRQMRANLLDVLKQDYIKTAIAKGLPEDKVIYKHALRNAINPLITIFGFEFASLLSGAALTETVLSYPGLGALTLEAARKLDVNLTMTSLMLGAIMLIAGNLIADILLKVSDPRIQFN
jgi:peptide/nickel transport system permease protein